ncbi:hypothetical protein ACFL0D_07915 [Thermoproteota archaeon]
MTNNSNIIRDKIFRFLKYLLILLFIVFFLRVLENQSSFIQFQVLDYIVTDKLIIRLIATMFFIYYGYFILVDLKIFIDLLNLYTARTLGYDESNKIKNIAYSIAAIIYLFLASLLILPFVNSIQTYGKVLASYLDLAFLAIIFIIIYNISNEVYSLTKNKIDETIDELTKKITQEISSRAKKSDDK